MTYADGASLDGLQQVVDRLAARLGRSVAVDDTHGRLVVASRHFGEEDPLRVYAIVHRASDPRVMAHFAAAGIYAWTEPGRVPGDAELGFKARVCCPIRHQGMLFGHLFLIDDGVSAAEVTEAAGATEHIGQLMYRRLVLHEEAQRRAAALVRELVSPDADARRAALAAADAEHLLAATDRVRALVLRPAATPASDGDDGATAVREAVETTLRDRHREVSLAWVRPTEAVVLLFGRAGGQAAQVGARLVDRCAAGGHGVVVGIGDEAPGADAVNSYADARRAARACTLVPGLGPVAARADLGVLDLLLRLPADDLRATYPAALARLDAADGADGLRATLAAYLDAAGDAGRTAADLRIHRSTLYYRLGRIEEIAGVDLRDGDVRLSLHLGVRARAVLGP